GTHKHGTPLHIDTLLSASLQNNKIIDKISLYVQTMVQEKLDFPVLMSFYGSYMTQLVGKATSLTEQLISTIVRQIDAGLKSRDRDYQSISYMIISQMVGHKSVSLVVLHQIIKRICSTATSVSLGDALSCIIYICQSTPVSNIPYPALVKLASMEDFADILGDMVERGFSIKRFQQIVMKSLIEECVINGEGIEYVKKMIERVEMKDSVANLVSTMITMAVDAPENHLQLVSKILRSADVQYHEQVDEGVEEAITKIVREKGHGAKMSRVMNKLFQGSRHEAVRIGDEYTTLLLSAEHPIPAVRLSSLENLFRLSRNGSSIDRSLIEGCILRRLEDEDDSIVRAVLDVADLLDLISHTPLLESLLRLAAGQRGRESGQKAFQWITKMLESEDEERDRRVLGSLFSVTLFHSQSPSAEIVKFFSTHGERFFPFTDVKVHSNAGEQKFNSEVIKAVAANIAPQGFTPTLDLIYQDYPSSRSAMHLYLCAALKETELQRSMVDVMLPFALKTLEQEGHTHIASPQPPTTESAEGQVRSLILAGNKSREALYVLGCIVERMQKVDISKALKGDENQKYHLDLLADIYSTITRLHPSFTEAYLIHLYSHQLGHSFILFLTLFWTYYERTEQIKTSSLELVHAFVSSVHKNSDLHSLVPSIIMLLSDKSYNIRRIAINTICLMTKGSATGETSVMKEFYKNNKVTTVPEQKMKKFVSTIANRKNDFLASEAYAAKWAAEYEDMDSITPFLLDVILSTEGIYGRLSLLSFVPSFDATGLQKMYGYVEDMVQRNKTFESPSDHIMQTEVTFLNMVAQRITKKSAPTMKKKIEDILTFVQSKLPEDPVQRQDSIHLRAFFFNCILKPDIFTQMGDKLQTKIFVESCRLDQQEKIKEEITPNLLQDLPVSMQTINHLLSKYEEKEIKGNDGKKAKTSGKETEAQDSTLSLILEKLGSFNSIKDSPSIIPRLFSILTYLASSSDFIGVNEEHCVLVCLSTLNQFISNVTEAEHKKEINREGLRIENLVQIYKMTSSNAIHNQIIEILGMLSEINAKSVTEHIVPLFTYIGNHTLNRGDNNTYRIFNRSIQMIIPQVISAGQSSKAIIKTFVNAYPNIPAHHRVSLYHNLLASIPATESDKLTYTLITLFEQQSGIISQWSEGLFELAHELLNKLSLVECDDNMQSLLRFIVTSSPNTSEEEKTKYKKTKPRLSELIKSVSGKEEYGLMVHVMTDFIANHITSSSYLDKILNTTTLNDKRKHQNALLDMFELTLQLMDNTMKTVKKKSALNDIIVGLLESVNQLLANSGFVQAVKRLLNHGDSNIRTRALILLNDKLEKESEVLTDKEIPLFLEMIDQFGEILNGTAKEKTVTTKQTALLTLEILSRNFTQGHEKKFAAVIPHITRGGLQSNNTQLSASASLCLASMISHMGVHALPHLSKVLPVMIQIFTKSLSRQDEEGTMLQISIISSIQSIAISLSSMMTPYLTPILKLVLEPQAVDIPEMVEHLNNLSAKIIQSADPRALTQSIVPALAHAMKTTRRDIMVSLLQMIPVVAQRVESVSMETASQTFFKAFISIFDVLIENQPTDGEKYVDAAIETFVGMVLRLNEDLFRPMLLKLVDWCHVTKGQEEHLLEEEHRPKISFFYRLLFHVAKTLKVIACPYFSYVQDHMIFCLQTNKESGGGSDFFDKMDVDEEEEESSTSVSDVTKFVLKSLEHCFENDQGQFINNSRFRQLLDPIVSQLGVESNAVATCANLGICLSDQLLWKEFNHKILYTTRSDESKTKVACLDVLHKFYTHLGDQVLSLVPETAPFLTELMEDTDPEVEESCHALIGLMEQQLGKDSITSNLS
ncbi:hypothetical protein PROFUN_04491, partial [Planoprotostelium fungivorum]